MAPKLTPPGYPRSAQDREWAFWVVNPAFPNEGERHVLCLAARTGIVVHGVRPLTIDCQDIRACDVHTATLRPYRALVCLRLLSQPQPVTLYMANPINPLGYGGDGDLHEAIGFAEVINHLTLGTPSSVPPNPYTRAFARKGQTPPGVAYTERYLSPMAYRTATARLDSARAIVWCLAALAMAVGIILMMAWLVTMVSG